ARTAPGDPRTLPAFPTRRSSDLETPRPHNAITMTKRTQVLLRPYPLVGIITPWNFPLALALMDGVPALAAGAAVMVKPSEFTPLDRKSTRLNSSHVKISYAVFCL